MAAKYLVDGESQPYCYFCYHFRQMYTTEGLELYEGRHWCYLCPECRKCMEIIDDFLKRLEER